jgi:hypothetical protein
MAADLPLPGRRERLDQRLSPDYAVMTMLSRQG